MAVPRSPPSTSCRPADLATPRAGHRWRLPVSDLLAALTDVGYAGFVTIEHDLNQAKPHLGMGELHESVRRSWTYLAAICEDTGRVA
jgi:hypothetical protein